MEALPHEKPEKKGQRPKSELFSKKIDLLEPFWSFEPLFSTNLLFCCYFFFIILVLTLERKIAKKIC